MDDTITFDLERLITILKQETYEPPPDDSLRRFIKEGKIKFYRRGTPVIDAGEIDDRLYLIVEGIYKLTWLDGQKICSAGFGAPGSLFFSPRGFYVRDPSFYSFVTSTDCKIMSWSKETVMRLADEDHQLCKWLLTYSIAQYYATETKMSALSGSARERYRSLAFGTPEQWRHIHNRPDLEQEVSSKDLSSYLGITPSYLSKIRKETLKSKSKAASCSRRTPAQHSHTRRTKEYLLELLTQTPTLTCAKLEEILGLSARRIKEYLCDLKEEGAIERVGNNRSGYWKVNLRTNKD